MAVGDRYQIAMSTDVDKQGNPSGGTTGQILAKKSATDYDTEWIDAPSGGSGSTITVTVGTTTTGNAGTDAVVTNSGTTENLVLDFVIPRGADGEDGQPGADGAPGAAGQDGQAATIAVGTVTTGTTPSVTNSGTSTAAVFDFVFPETPATKTEDWTFELEDGSTVTKKVVLAT